MKNFKKYLVFTGIVLSVVASNVSAFPALTPEQTKAIVTDFKTPNYSQLLDKPASEVVLGIQHLVINTAKVEDITKNLKIAIEDKYKAEDKKEVKAAYLKTLENLKKLSVEDIKSKEFTTKLFKDFTDTELKALGIDRKDIAAIETKVEPKPNFSTGITGEVKEQINNLLCQIEDMERKRVEDDQKHLQILQDLHVKMQKKNSEFDPKELLKAQQDKDKQKYDDLFARLFNEPKKEEEKKAEAAPSVSPMPQTPKKEEKPEEKDALDQEIPRDRPPVQAPQVGFEETEASKVQPTLKVANTSGKKEVNDLDDQIDVSKSAIDKAKTALNNPLVANPQMLAMNPMYKSLVVQNLRDELVRVKNARKNNEEALKTWKKTGKKLDDMVAKGTQDASKLVDDKGETKRFEQIVSEKKDALKDAQERASKCRSEQECAVLDGIVQASQEALRDAKKKQTLLKNNVDQKTQQAIAIAEEARLNKEDGDESSKELKTIDSDLQAQEQKIEQTLTSLVAVPMQQQPQGTSLSDALARRNTPGTAGPALGGSKEVRN